MDARRLHRRQRREAITLKVDRPLAAVNPAQDRPVAPGPNILMYADGHPHVRGWGRFWVPRQPPLRHVCPLDADGAGGPWRRGCSSESGRLPADATASQTLLVPPYAVSPNRTDGACSSAEVALGGAGAAGWQIVAAEALMDKTMAAGKLVHHVILLCCEREELWNRCVGGGDGAATWCLRGRRAPSR